MDANSSDFERLVAEACEHLYDPIYMRKHRLARMLVADADLAPKDLGWRLQGLLLAAIEELDPGPNAPVDSLEVRRYELLALHYGDGIEPQAVADRLGISRRHFYREKQAALEALAAVLRERVVLRPLQGTRPQGTRAETEQTDRMALLRLEAARLTRADRFSLVQAVLPGVLDLLKERFSQHDLVAAVEIPVDLPEVALNSSLLRQIVLAMCSCVAERASKAVVTLSAHLTPGSVLMFLRVVPPQQSLHASAPQAAECIAALDDMAKLGQVELRPSIEEGRLIGFDLLIPIAPRRTVLVIDDNPEVCELMWRYLTEHGYGVISAHSASEARALALDAKPYAITLDLMMPEQDGWDLLQCLQNQPETRNIPVIVCSVLRVRELALSLGATAFVCKPITEQVLLQALEALQ